MSKEQLICGISAVIACKFLNIRGECSPKKPTSEAGTVGDFLEELKEKSDLKPKTLEGTLSQLRKIVADITGQGPPQGGAPGRHATWRQAVESVKLTELTLAQFQHWKLSFVASAGEEMERIRY